MQRPAERPIARFFHPSRAGPKGIVHIEPIAGKQVEITPTVRDFASRFRITDDVASVVPVIEAVKALKPSFVTAEEMRQLYAKRTATDIIHSGTVPAVDKEGRAAGPKMLGCLDYGIALTAALRALGLRANLVRSDTDTYVRFTHAGKDYMVGSSRYISPQPLLVTEQSRKAIEKLKAEGTHDEGDDAWALGIKGHEDFARFKKK